MAIKQNIFFAAMILSLGWLGCKSPCDGLDCGKYGKCDKATATCICDTGYEGLQCETRTITKFIGSFQCDEICDSGSNTYEVTIAEDLARQNGITLENLYSTPITINGTVEGNNLQIATQPFGNGSIQGNGVWLSTGQLELTMSITIGSSVDQCQLSLEAN